MSGAQVGAGTFGGTVLLAGLLAVPSVAHADDVEVWPRFTLGWQNTYSAESVSARFMYPQFAMAVEAAAVEFEFETPGPFLIVDGVIALIRFLVGSDEGLPLFNALNRDEPGAIDLWSVALRFRVAEEKHVRAMVGLSSGLQLLRFDYPQTQVIGDDVDTTANALAGNIGPTFSARFPGEDSGGLLTLEVGTGLISQSSWNPYVGGLLSGYWHTSEHVRLYGQVHYRAQRWNFIGEDSYAPDPQVQEMIHFVGVQLGFSLNPD